MTLIHRFESDLGSLRLLRLCELILHDLDHTKCMTLIAVVLRRLYRCMRD